MINAYIDLKEYSHLSRRQYADNPSQVDCDELARREELNHQYSQQREGLLEQQAQAIGRNDTASVASISDKLDLLTTSINMNLAIVEMIRGTPINISVSNLSASDIVRFLAAQSGPQGGGDFYGNPLSDLSINNEEIHSRLSTAVQGQRFKSTSIGTSSGSRYSVDPFNYYVPTFDRIYVNVPASITVRPFDGKCALLDERCGLLAAGVTFDVYQSDICDAMIRDDLLDYRVTFSSGSFTGGSLSIHFQYGFKERERLRSRVDAIVEDAALDEILKPFIVDVLNTTQLYRVSDDPLKKLVGGTYFGDLRQALVELNDDIVADFGREPSDAELEDAFTDSHLDRYQDAGNGNVAFVLTLGKKTSRIVFFHNEQGVGVSGLSYDGKDIKLSPY